MSRQELFEVAWSFSFYLSVFPDSPQFVAYYHYLGPHTSIDWFLMIRHRPVALNRATPERLYRCSQGAGVGIPIVPRRKAPLPDRRSEWSPGNERSIWPSIGK